MRKLLAIIFIAALIGGGIYFVLPIFNKAKEDDASSAKKTMISRVVGIKTTYMVNEPFLSEDSQVVIKFNNGEQDDITVADLTITGFDTTNPGSARMKITYQTYTYNMDYIVSYKSISLIYENGSIVSNWPRAFALDKKPESNTFFVYTYDYNNKMVKYEYKNDAVAISNFDVNTISQTSKTATVTCGGKSVDFNYTVWWTPLNKVYDCECENNSYKLTLVNFKIKTDGTVSGKVIVKDNDRSVSCDVMFSTWELSNNNVLYIKDSNGKVVAKYFSGGDLYVMANSVLNFETSIMNFIKY